MHYLILRCNNTSIVRLVNDNECSFGLLQNCIEDRTTHMFNCHIDCVEQKKCILSKTTRVIKMSETKTKNNEIRVAA